MKKQEEQEKKQRELNKNNLKSARKEIEQCKQLRDEYLSGWQRTKADFLNYQKGENKRIESVLNSIEREWILKMLEIHDNLERARTHVPKKLKDVNWVNGVLQIENQFHSFFKEHSVKRIDPLEKQFDPNFHEAVEQVEMEGKESGIIVEVLEKGYTLKGKVIRPAKVKITK